jgi:hypothetical protein
MGSEFGKFNLALTVGDLAQAWQDRLDDAVALDDAGR